MIIRTWAAIIILLFAGVAVHATDVDSLRRELAKATSVKERSGLLFAIGKWYYSGAVREYDSALVYFGKAKQLARNAGYDTVFMEANAYTAYSLSSGMTRFAASLPYFDTAIVYARRLPAPQRLVTYLVEKGNALTSISMLPEAQKVLREALATAQENGDKKGEANTYDKLATYYSGVNNMALQLDCINRAIVINDSLGRYPEVADGYKLIGLSYCGNEQYQKSIRYLVIADSMYEQLGINDGRVILKMYMGVNYNGLGDHKRAIKLYHECLDSVTKDKFMQLLLYSYLGTAYDRSGSFEEARQSFNRSLELNKEYKVPAYDANNYEGLSRAFLRIRQPDSALFYAKKCEAVCRDDKTGVATVMACVLLMRDVYEGRGDMAMALEYQKQYTSILDSNYRVMMRNNTADAQTRLGLTEKNKEISALSAENELQNVKAQKQTLLNTFLLVALALGGVIVVLIVTAYRRSLKQNQLLAQQKQELQQQKDIIDAQVIQLDSASKMKSKFLANISHELRTPVTLLNGMLEIMSDGNKQGQTKEKERLDIAYNNSRKLQQMVEEILDLTKLEHNKAEPVYETKEAGPLVKRMAYAFETLVEKEGLVLDYNDEQAKGLYISVDTGKFEKVMNNLVYNAIKFNRKGGRVSVSLYPDNGGRHLCIDVTDTGIGIGAADLPHIFEHFYQGETKGLKAAGAGIGLSLVKEFTTLMGGTVDVKSTPGAGTTFTLRFGLAEHPVASGEQPMEQPEKPIEAWGSFAMRQKVLIVEDNAEMRYYLQEVLGEYVDITTAANGHEGLACLEGSQPDLIISDVMMPGMDGREFVNQLKAQDRFKKIPVITLTALADMETQLSFLRLGVDDYIVKPFNAEELRIRVYNLLVNQSERRAFNEEPLEAGDVPTDSKEAEEFRRRVTEYVLARIKNINVSVIDLADELALSERQLYRLSKSLTGYSPAQLVKEIRLQKAYELLLSGNIYKVDDVCRRVGYEKASYFAQQFYERFGKRPSEFL